MQAATIRRATGRDADALARCMDATYAPYAERIDGLPSMSADCAEEIDKYDVWVAEVGAVIVGGLVLVPGDGFMLLANVAVHSDNRGAGIGRRLLALAETEAVRCGYAEMRLNTHVDMPRAFGSTRATDGRR